MSAVVCYEGSHAMEQRITAVKPTFQSYYSSRFPKASSEQQRRLVHYIVYRLGPRYRRVPSCLNLQVFEFENLRRFVFKNLLLTFQSTLYVSSVNISLVTCTQD